MKRRITLAGLLLVAGAGPVAAAPHTIDGKEETGEETRLSLIETGLVEDRAPSGAWRLPEDALYREGEEEDGVRLRIKLRPNRAMGRLSLNF